MSNLIKENGQSILRIDAFEAEEFSDRLPGEEDLNEKLARLEKEAYEKGFEQGQRDGLALEQKQMEEWARQLEKVFSGLNGLKARLYSEGEQELLTLSILMAKTVIRDEVRTRPDIICNTLRAAFDYLRDTNMIRVRLNPEDMDEVKKILPDLSLPTKGGRFELVEDNTIETGGCILETGFGRINATIGDQIDMLEQVIRNEFETGEGRSR